MPQEYPLEITENAKRYGFKAANLMFLEACVKDFQRGSSSQRVIIPEIEAIENDQIIAHLKANILDFEQKWQKFCDLQIWHRATIKPEAIQALTELQTAIKDCFKNHLFEPARLPNSTKFMVRSSGEEDRVDVANPGGNESIASLPENISESIGIVIASYVSEKSLLQRLKSGEDITSHFPLSPCLVQSMISGKTERNPATSGVIYTDNGHTRIQSAPGHGELIVNSKGNFDNYYITPKGKVYAEIRDKHIRLTPKMNESTGKMEQVEQANDFSQATSPSLDEETATYLHDLANFIEQQYGMRMDIEFVYDSSSKTANIVQARPIPEGDRRGTRPSALANRFISYHSPQNLKASVITPDINSASVITRPEEILICDSIEQALDIYLKSANQIKAVIVKRDAPDTSHEAGMFTSKAIPVLQMENLEEARQWAANLTDNVLICDPQHKKLYQIHKSEYSEELIQEGIYASTLTPHVTPFKREFKSDEAIRPLFSAMQTKNIVRKYDGKLLREHLDNLALPKFGEDAMAQKDILANLLQFNARMQKKEQISADLFKEIMLTGGELHQLLSSMEKEAYNEERSKYYLNVFEKFNGLITAQRKKDVLSSSLVQEISSANTKAKYSELVAEREEAKSFFQILEEFLGNFEESSSLKLTDRQKELFLEVAKLDKFIMTPENQAKWREFCFESCKNNQGLVLANLSKDLVKLVLHEYFLNTSFLSEYNKDKTKALANLYREFDSGKAERDNLAKADRMISQMEHQITEWSKPEKFAELHANLHKNLSELKDLLHFDSQENLTTALQDKLNGMLIIKYLNRLVDIVDLSIKAVQTSGLYDEEQKDSQIQNFHTLIVDFNELMQKLIASSPEEKIPERLTSLSAFINSKNESIAKRELDPSRDFNVSAADIYQLRSEAAKGIFIGGDSFGRAFEGNYSKTLADAHTLVHQTALKSISMHAEKINKALESNHPTIIQEIQRHFRKSKTFLDFTIEFEKFDISPSLIYSQLEGSNIHLHYNVPLRQHSGLVDIKYNYNSKKFNISYQMVGASEDRWEPLTHLGKLLIEDFTDAKVTQNNHSENHMLLEVQVDNLQSVQTSLDIFNMLSVSTFQRKSLNPELKPGGRIYKALENKFEQISLNPIIYTKEDIALFKDLYTSAKLSFSQLIKQETLDRLIVLNNLGINLDNLKSSPVEKVQALLTCKPEIFNLLTSVQAIKALRIYSGDPSNLIDIENVEHIERMISDASINLFKNGIYINVIKERAIWEDQQEFSKKENELLDSLGLLALNSNKLKLLDKLIEESHSKDVLNLSIKVMSRLFEKAIFNNDIQGLNNILTRYDILERIHGDVAPKKLEPIFKNALNIATHGHADVLTKLIQEAETRNISTHISLTFNIAARNGQTDIIKTLLDIGINVDQNELESTALYNAVNSGHSETVKALLDAGADIKKANFNGHTALGNATIKGYTKIIEMLKKSAESPVDYLLASHRDNPIGLIKAIRNLAKDGLLDTDSKKITQFLNQEVADGKTTNFRKIIKSSDRESFELALSFKPKLATSDVSLINKFYPGVMTPQRNTTAAAAAREGAKLSGLAENDSAQSWVRSIGERRLKENSKGGTSTSK